MVSHFQCDGLKVTTPVKAPCHQTALIRILFINPTENEIIPDLFFDPATNEYSFFDITNIPTEKHRDL